MSRFSKIDRHLQLQEFIKVDPFCNDEKLAEHFKVSVQTIRLDRIALGIPELRERLKFAAHENYKKPKSLKETEIIGELIDISLDEEAYSILDIREEHILEKTGIARAQHLFAQANSLAIAVIDAEMVLTGSARVRYKRPVYFGERVMCKAVVKVKKVNTYLVSVYSKVDGEMVFKGQFIVQAQFKK